MVAALRRVVLLVEEADPALQPLVSWTNTVLSSGWRTAQDAYRSLMADRAVTWPMAGRCAAAATAGLRT